MTEALGLKACPFCGEKAEMERVGDRRQSTLYCCTHCGCSLETGEEWGHGTGWNNRPLEQEALDKLRAVEAERDALRALVKTAFEAGITLANSTSVKTLDDVERLWEWSQVKADLAALTALTAPPAPDDDGLAYQRQNWPAPGSDVARLRQVMAAWHLAYGEPDRDNLPGAEADRQSAMWFAHWMKLGYPTAHEAEEHSGDCTKQPWACLRCHAEAAMRSVDAALTATPASELKPVPHKEPGNGG